MEDVADDTSDGTDFCGGGKSANSFINNPGFELFTTNVLLAQPIPFIHSVLVLPDSEPDIGELGLDLPEGSRPTEANHSSSSHLHRIIPFQVELHLS